MMFITRIVIPGNWEHKNAINVLIRIFPLMKYINDNVNNSTNAVYFDDDNGLIIIMVMIIIW